MVPGTEDAIVFGEIIINSTLVDTKISKVLPWLGFGMAEGLYSAPDALYGWDKGALIFMRFGGMLALIIKNIFHFFEESLPNRKSTIVDCMC